jgi:hypothetical protein
VSWQSRLADASLSIGAPLRAGAMAGAVTTSARLGTTPRLGGLARRAGVPAVGAAPKPVFRPAHRAARLVPAAVAAPPPPALTFTPPASPLVRVPPTLEAHPPPVLAGRSREARLLQPPLHSSLPPLHGTEPRRHKRAWPPPHTPDAAATHVVVPTPRVTLLTCLLRRPSAWRTSGRRSQTTAGSATPLALSPTSHVTSLSSSDSPLQRTHSTPGAYTTPNTQGRVLCVQSRTSQSCVRFVWLVACATSHCLSPVC